MIEIKTYLSLFSGCGMFEHAIKQVYPDADCIGYSEIDKYAISVYEKHYPDHPYLGDITKININELPDFDLMVCGFPCTNLSIAGNRKGLEGEQSKLFYNAIEILKIKKPKYFIFENVESMSNENRDIITKTIREIYPDVNLIMINGALVSAQARKRYFWTNFYVDQPTDKKIFLKHIMQSENEIDKKYYLSEKSIASVKRIIDKEKDYARILENFDTKAKTITTRCYASHNADFLNIKKIGYIKSDSQGNRIYNAKYKAVNQSANGGGLGAKTGLYEIENEVIRKLTPIEAERLFTLPDNYTEYGKGDIKISDSQRYKMLGNGVIADVVKHILLCLKNEVKEYSLFNL
jgi:DNA (cytosine-5)-methyltransferase 3A